VCFNLSLDGASVAWSRIANSFSENAQRTSRFDRVFFQCESPAVKGKAFVRTVSLQGVTSQ
jgi:hypothetical protein